MLSSDSWRCESIIIVNDDPSFVDVVGDALRAQGLAVLLVPGVVHAIRAMQTGFRADAILVDVLEHEAIGGLLDALRVDPQLRATPVIARSRRTERLVQLAPGRHFHSIAMPADAAALVELIERASRAPWSDGLRAST